MAFAPPRPEFAPRLCLALHAYREGRAIDWAQTVSRISQGQILPRFPRERRRRFGPTLLLIEDHSRRLIPFRADQRLVRWALRRLLPAGSLWRAVMDEHLASPQLLSGDWPPPPGTLVLALGDLGSLAVQGERLWQRWQAIGAELQAAGCHPLALFPGPLSRCPAPLAAVWRLVPWERPRTEHDGAPPELRAERLLRLAAAAARLEPGLLRALRLLLPAAQADAATEADVWQHSALSSDSAAAASLYPESAQAWRQALAADPTAAALRQRLIRALKRWRGGLPVEIWYEELLNFDPDALAGDSAMEDLSEDRADAEAYFADFCAENPNPDALHMPACDRAWLLRVSTRATGVLWQNPEVGLPLRGLAAAISPSLPDGVAPRQISHRGKPERDIHLLQVGPRLLLSAAGAGPAVGSPWGVLRSRNGWVELVGEGETDDSAHPAGLIVPTLQRGNAVGDAPASRNATLERQKLHSHAGAWERSSVEESRWAEGLPIPPAARIQIRSDCMGLSVGQIGKPHWAKAMGRDRFGLWAEFAIAVADAPPVRQCMRWIAPGRFWMGSPADEPGRWEDEGPRHLVTLSTGFWLFDTPCTQALWQAVMGDNPSRFKSPRRPVETVSWNDVERFLGQINAKVPGLTLALPTEAQWEYACRAGTDTALYTGPIDILGDRKAPALGKIAWYGGNSGEGFELAEGWDTSSWDDMEFRNPKAGTREVGTKLPNGWGLYDMLGNVLEWVQDGWHSNYDDAPTDGSVWVPDGTGAARVLRGGSWNNLARSCRSAFRLILAPGLRNYDLGFRCALVQA